MSSAFWRDADEDLIALNREGLSCSQIAKRLSDKFHVSVSRNAVIGRLNRCGVAKMRRASAPRSLEPRASPPRREQPPPRGVLPPSIEPRPLPVLVDPLTPTIGSMFDLTPHACRWPIGDAGYCGRTCEGFRDSFCDAHKSMGTRPSKKPFRPDDVSRAINRREDRGAVYRVW